ncbi:hypothetical protein GBAR_LOCUS28507 [Geodia barretti]|uniref:Uncharacterized protein n=1 Tax=Geodia barretti TaxID=519541 RepID=A0AA35TS35_GEOBA|nr:hypothetical protein GBAR_LOCUS28507 [Geodia barretti]
MLLYPGPECFTSGLMAILIIILRVIPM